jgi:hypothetical protein
VWCSCHGHKRYQLGLDRQRQPPASPRAQNPCKHRTFILHLLQMQNGTKKNEKKIKYNQKLLFLV